MVGNTSEDMEARNYFAFVFHNSGVRMTVPGCHLLLPVDKSKLEYAQRRLKMAEFTRETYSCSVLKTCISCRIVRACALQCPVLPLILCPDANPRCLIL